MLPITARPQRIASALLDTAMGIETATIERHEDLEFGPDRGVNYVATPWINILHLRGILRGMKIKSDDVFIDLGSGKGRVVLAASAFPFKRVEGVELSKKLHVVAQANLSKHVKRVKCGEVILTNSDVAAFSFPADASVLYLYNPFKGQVFRAVLKKLQISLEQYPRKIRIIYTNPVMHQSLVACGFTQILQKGTTKVYVND